MTMILSKTATLAGIGLVLGVGGALVFSRVLSGLLFGVGPSDAPTFVVAAALLGVAALAAGSIPALRATTIDPVDALKR
jgi:ABC-type antimicrobial peptide transport system permease subunit